ncbi:uncharacterized protein LOC133895834 isoform X2 [Phragmites australis]|uniref:uncharacterized protein LOC133895834 isoform X2 n=1 Tax=Phragmites australis TaxID=29695 RepID=UPI002D774A5F|nr:uncharacterized protein LOC133895834 isoform X2 [Phragmites australis]
MTPRRRREPSEPRSESDWDGGSSREVSPDLVRRVARHYHDPAAQISHAADAGAWLSEIEHDRVHLIQDWVQMAACDRDEDAGPPPSPADHSHKGVLRIRGHQACLELVMRMAADRQAELQRLSQHRAVSDFPHRVCFSVLRATSSPSSSARSSSPDVLRSSPPVMKQKSQAITPYARGAIRTTMWVRKVHLVEE